MLVDLFIRGKKTSHLIVSSRKRKTCKSYENHGIVDLQEICIELFL